MRVLSLGAGVQSSTLFLMSCEGELPKLDAAIFADTGWEPKAVYEWLQFLEIQAIRYNIPIYQVSRGNLREDAIEFRMNRRSSDGKHFASMPVFIKNMDGSQGMVRRQCTKEYKIEPIEKRIRELIGLKPRQRSPKEPVVEQWRGISWEEIYRMRPSDQRWMEVKYPLIDLRMTRNDCLRWMSDHGYPEPPRSACLGCPYHNDAEWRKIRENPIEWADAVEFDKEMRQREASGQSERKMLVGLPYVHRSMVPLDEVDLSTDEERGQPNLFNNECEGMCGI